MTTINENSEIIIQEQSKALIKVKNVKKYYENGNVKALNDINLEIYKGEFISIIGSSGSGKSTLLNLLGALDKPTSGKVIINDIDISNAKNLSQLRSKEIGFIFQLHNLLPNLTALENVQIPLIGTGIRENEMINIGKYLLEAVGLGDKFDKKPSVLSGGERQRVAIARALVNKPSIILADEPTGSLDSKNSAMILDLLKEIYQQNNVTLIIVTHDLTVAKMADEIIQIKDGINYNQT